METNLETLPIGEDAPRLVNAVIEVPVGSRNKYEYEPDLGVIMRDRVLPGAVRYPTDYGFVPSTLTDRGDALDIVVADYDPAFPGCVVRVRPIGALHITVTKYRANPESCNGCPLKPECTPGENGRLLRRSFDEEFLQRARAYRQTEPYKKALHKRRCGWSRWSLRLWSGTG